MSIEQLETELTAEQIADLKEKITILCEALAITLEKIAERLDKTTTVITEALREVSQMLDGEIDKQLLDENNSI